MKRLNITARPDDFILAVRAAKNLMDRPHHERDALIIFNDGSRFVVTRRKASITVKQLTSTDGENR